MIVICLTSLTAWPGHAETQQNLPQGWPFFAFDNGVGRDHDWQPALQAELLARLGYDGIGYSWVRNVEARKKAHAERNQKIFSFYEPCYLEADEPLDATTMENLSALKGTDSILWLLPVGTCSEDEAVERFRRVADLAAEHGIRVALYPHNNTFVETGARALELVRLVNRDNFGMSINLCHELKAGTGDQLTQLVKDSILHLYLVSINGADNVDDPSREKDWARLIQPLGEGDFDVRPLLEQLRDSGYHGPIGLQCYMIPGDIEANLKKSIAAWRELTDSVADE